MTPSDYPLNLYRGDTGRWKFILWADEGKTVPVDLTGVIAAAQIRDKSGGQNIIDMTCVIAEPNIIDMTLPATLSKLLPSKGYWDLQLTYLSGDVMTVVFGKVTVTADITDTIAAKKLRAVS